MKDALIGTHSLEVTGLGIIIGLLVALGSLVADGSFGFSHYLVFLGFMLLGVAGLLWRILSPAPVQRAKPGRQLQP
jgi:hypothetical protein